MTTGGPICPNCGSVDGHTMECRQGVQYIVERRLPGEHRHRNLIEAAPKLLSDLQAAHELIERMKTLVSTQAEDEGLWFMAQTAPEAYLQQELRRLHALIEKEIDDAKA